MSNLINKWKGVLDHEGLAPINDKYRKQVTAILLENQEKAVMEQAKLINEAYPTGDSSGSMGTAATGGGFDPILIALVRRAMPQLMAYDVCGVQPMSMPTGLIFAMKSRYAQHNPVSTSDTEALYIPPTGVVSSDYSGATSPAASGTDPFAGGYQVGNGMTTSTGEGLTPNEMGFTIEKVTVTAATRALKSEYSIEMAQDLKAVHGLDAESELSNILSNEIMFEINREVMGNIYTVAKAGAQKGTTTAGTFDLDTDSDGRWSVERFKGLLFQADREANYIAKDTRRGAGNFLVVSSDVASALAMAGKLDYAPALKTDLNVDEAQDTFCGTLNGKYKVYVDPYFYSATNDLMVVGYKGKSPYDAGLFFCPYVPLQQVRAVDPNTFQPKIGFKTRYGLVGNPFFGSGALTANNNGYFRKVRVLNLM
jgi:Major capsid protein Gp23